jgi:type 1 glutamine amidotransferase
MLKIFRLLQICVLAVTVQLQAADKKIILLAGPPSHGKGEHEFNAGCHLLEKCLNKVPGVHAEVYNNGWPKDEKVFEGADAVFIYSDGGGGHPFNRPERRKVIEKLMEKGVGLGCGHYAVEVPKGELGDEFLKWIGGYFEINWSVNPTWTASFKSLPTHAITRGVNPFSIQDEWYYHMRFPEPMTHVTPILSTIPPKETVSRENGTHSGNPAVREAVAKGEPQTVMWAIERPDGGRGFGFTGGHYHRNWADNDFRKIVLNAIVWSAKGEVPAKGIESEVSAQDLKENLDQKK